MYDLRYLRKDLAGSKQQVDAPEPVLSFQGHVNTYLEDLVRHDLINTDTTLIPRSRVYVSMDRFSTPLG